MVSAQCIPKSALICLIEDEHLLKNTAVSVVCYCQFLTFQGLLANMRHGRLYVALLFLPYETLEWERGRWLSGYWKKLTVWWGRYQPLKVINIVEDFYIVKELYTTFRCTTQCHLPNAVPSVCLTTTTTL